MKAGAVLGDLILFSRLASAAEAAGADILRVDDPADLPAGLDLVLVDWSDRQSDWAESLRAGSHQRIILFGPHTDLESHTAAREAGLGPMWARSRLLSASAALFSKSTA